MKRLTLGIALICFALTGSNSQVIDIGKFLAAGQEDAEVLMQGYLGPYFNAFGASMTGGWYNTAGSHSLGGFDITATFNTSFVPDEDLKMDLSQLTLNSLQLAPGASEETPTIAGKNETGSQLNYYNIAGLPDTKAFDMPKGTGVAYVPSPMLQLSVGLIKETDIIGRYMPPIRTGETEIGMWGIGFKHGIKQWIPVLERIPVLQLSVHYGYTKMNANVGLDVTPDMVGLTDHTTADISWENQKMTFVTQSHTGNLLVSANLPVVCFYGGIGFASTKTNLDLKGYYPSIDISQAPSAVVTDNSALLDPINMEIKNTDGSITKPRFNAGMRLKFAIFTLHFDYTYANYSMATVGMGFTFR